MTCVLDSMMEKFTCFLPVGSLAASSLGLRLDCVWFLYPVRGWGKCCGAGQRDKNSIPGLGLQLPLKCFAPACFLRVQGYSWPAASPKWPALVSSVHFGMCSQHAQFPPSLGSPRKKQLSLLSYSPSKERFGCAGFCPRLNLCISVTACSVLHFWHSGHIEHVMFV